MWIEIQVLWTACKVVESHFPQGKCGLKYDEIIGMRHETVGHFPQGKCGLKSVVIVMVEDARESLPAREVWIEISNTGQ